MTTIPTIDLRQAFTRYRRSQRGSRRLCWTVGRIGAFYLVTKSRHALEQTYPHTKFEWKAVLANSAAIRHGTRLAGAIVSIERVCRKIRTAIERTRRCRADEQA
jgi:hypothetical protein